MNHVDSVLNVKLLHFTLNFTLGALEKSVTLYYATFSQDASVAQLVERREVMQEIGGSIPETNFVTFLQTVKFKKKLKSKKKKRFLHTVKFQNCTTLVYIENYIGSTLHQIA